MVFTGQIGQTVYNEEFAIAIPGQIIGMGQYHAMPYLNTASGVRPVYTVTPPNTVDANTTYSLLIDGTLISFTTGGSTTTVQLGQGLYAAIRASGVAFRKVDASVNGSTGVVTLTGRYFNVAVPITSPTNASTTNDLTIATSTAPGTSTEIPFGRFVGRTSAETVDDYGISAAKLINSNSGFTVLGVTLKSYEVKNAIGPTAQIAYPFQTTMSVLQDCVAIQGVWVECVETNIAIGDTCYVAVGSGNEGKASRTSSGNIDLSARASFITPTKTAPDGRLMVGVYLKR